MSTFIRCDGCGVFPLRGPEDGFVSAMNAAGETIALTDRPGTVPAPRVSIIGERSDGCGGGGLPSGTFHWCTECALVAFNALAARRAAAAQ